MTNKQFEKYYQKYYIERKIIQRIARKFCLGNSELYKDLVQEGLIRLWELDPSKATSNPDSYIRQAIKFSMVDYLRHTEPEKYDSLDSRLLAGEQLEKDPLTGELRILSHRTDVRLDREFRDNGNGREVEIDEDTYE